MGVGQQTIIEALKRSETYPHKVSYVKVEETHISWVFLTGIYAYKIKKELTFGEILDFSTLKLRKNICQKEGVAYIWELPATLTDDETTI